MPDFSADILDDIEMSPSWKCLLPAAQIISEYSCCFSELHKFMIFFTLFYVTIDKSVYFVL